ncbi:unnamed protein product [Citrullus colocynthis]|uniref:Wax synthase domain-containing protein n=1 Tax=Citrullus colocynthis TaxID=252529 RepID=A0ABP0YPB2_9ROSI
MAAEIRIFLQTLFLVSSSLCFCFTIRNSIPNGFFKFLLILPFFFLFLYIPLQFQTIHLQGSIGFFIGWLASFKLLLFAFGKGPLCCSAASSSLRRFLAVGSLPIEIPDHEPPKDRSNPGPVLPLSFSAKLGFLILTIIAINFKNHFHPNAYLIFLCLVIYFLLEILIGSASALVKATLGVELLPYFDEPYLSDSLQDFWGRRWNLMTSRILRLSVYDPCRKLTVGVVGRRPAAILALTATFAVSGLMHELIYFYMGRLAPTWEVTCFFLLHGVCLAAEMAIKSGVGGRFRLPGVVSVPLTIGFVVTTSFWLFFPQFLRFKADVRMFEEHAALGAFVKSVMADLITQFKFISFQVK